jgi:hypothetical protein
MTMQWHGLRVQIIILSLIGGLLLFFGGQFLYNKYNVEKPLEELINDNQYVQQVAIEKTAGITYLEVKLKNEDVNIAELYEELYLQTGNLLKNETFEIKFVDKPDKQLNDLWQSNQYYVYQAIMQGNFPEMVDNIVKTAADANIKAEVYVNNENVFVQLTKENGSNLLRIVPRQNFMVTGQVANMGGVAGVKRN